MPRLQGVVVDEGQGAPPTRRGGGRGARCPAYKSWWWTRGKMPRLEGAVVDAGQDAPPTGRGGGRGARKISIALLIQSLDSRLRRVVGYFAPDARLGLYKMNFQTGSYQG